MIQNLAKIVKSNSVIIITNFIVANRAVLKHIVLNARKDFAKLMNVTYHLKQNAVKKRVDSKKKRETNKKFAVVKEIFVVFIFDHESIVSHSNFDITESQAVIHEIHSHVNSNKAILFASLMKENEKMIAFLNVHIVLHFVIIIEKYELL